MVINRLSTIVVSKYNVVLLINLNPKLLIDFLITGSSVHLTAWSSDLNQVIKWKQTKPSMAEMRWEIKSPWVCHFHGNGSEQHPSRSGHEISSLLSFNPTPIRTLWQIISDVSRLTVMYVVTLNPDAALTAEIKKRCFFFRSGWNFRAAEIWAVCTFCPLCVSVFRFCWCKVPARWSIMGIASQYACLLFIILDLV